MTPAICVIDSGVALDGIASHHEVMPDFSVRTCDSGKDTFGHGTAIAGIIRRHAPESPIHSIRAMHSPRGDHSGNLLGALAFALQQPDWKVINVSLSISHPDPRLRKLVDSLVDDGRTIISAVSNDPSKTAWPAAFENVIAVEHDYFEIPLDHCFDPTDPSKVFAHGIYVEAPTPGGESHFYTGSSFAAAHVSALVALGTIAASHA